MTAWSSSGLGSRFYRQYITILRGIIFALCIVSGLGILTMMIVTCVDILMRIFGSSLTGAYDIVKLASAVTISCALPYTTAVKGHVAIEFLFLKMKKTWRIIVDTIIRLLSMTLFALLTWRCIEYGVYLKEKGNATMTLHIPTFWVMYVIAFSCMIVILITFEHLLRPGKEMIKP